MRPHLPVRHPAGQPPARPLACASAPPVNSDPDVTAAPLLGLSSGYVQRSQDKFPKQGSRFPWQVHQSYLRDYRALRVAGIHDDAMTFSNPTPAETDLVAAAS